MEGSRKRKHVETEVESAKKPKVEEDSSTSASVVVRKDTGPLRVISKCVCVHAFVCVCVNASIRVCTVCVSVHVCGDMVVLLCFMSIDAFCKRHEPASSS